jgi:hypothetical protein
MEESSVVYLRGEKNPELVFSQTKHNRYKLGSDEWRETMNNLGEEQGSNEEDYEMSYSLSETPDFEEIGCNFGTICQKICTKFERIVHALLEKMDADSECPKITLPYVQLTRMSNFPKFMAKSNIDKILQRKLFSKITYIKSCDGEMETMRNEQIRIFANLFSFVINQLEDVLKNMKFAEQAYQRVLTLNCGPEPGSGLIMVASGSSEIDVEAYQAFLEAKKTQRFQNLKLEAEKNIKIHFNRAKNKTNNLLKKSKNQFSATKNVFLQKEEELNLSFDCLAELCLQKGDTTSFRECMNKKNQDLAESYCKKFINSWHRWTVEFGKKWMDVISQFENCYVL